MTDHLQRALAHDGGLRVLSVDVGEAAAETCRRHGLAGRAAILATEGLVASALLSAHVKGEERMLVQVQAEAPRFAFTAEVRADGGVRARMTPGAVGDASLRGTLVAIKHDAERELYRGVANIEGSFAEALEHYLVQSQQTLGRVSIQGATGQLVERLPEGPEELPDELGPLRVLETLPLHFQCTCSLERVEGTLRALGAEELRSLADEEGQGEVTCHFCNETYVVPGERLIELAELSAG